MSSIKPGVKLEQANFRAHISIGLIENLAGRSLAKLLEHGNEDDDDDDDVADDDDYFIDST